VLGLVGVLARDRQEVRDQFFLLLWMGLVAVLIYVPWNLQRRFLEGVQVPLGLLAGVGLVHIAGRLRGVRSRELLLVAAVGVITVGNLYMTAGLTLGAAIRQPALFWPADVMAAVDWLGGNASWTQTVLAAPDTGSLIPAQIGHRVVLGHEMETVDYEGKRTALVRFFSADLSNAERLVLVRRWEVSWVFHGPEERSLGGFDPESAPWLVPVVGSGRVNIYRVSPEGMP
jgi:hypothetical protein